jgi:hypothetical protein
MNRMKKICAGLLLFAFCFSALPQAMAKDDKEAEVRAALAKFVQAFDNLDWETFAHPWQTTPPSFIPGSSPVVPRVALELRKLSNKFLSVSKATRPVHPTWICNRKISRFSLQEIKWPLPHFT